MLHKTSLAVLVITASLSACGGGGGSDTAVSANPPAPVPGPAPGPAPGPGAVDTTPITAPSPSPDKVPAPLPPPPPAPAGLRFSGADIQRAMRMPIPAIGNTGTSQEAGQYVHDGLDNKLADYIVYDGQSITTRTLAAGPSGYTPSREASVAMTQAGGSLAPTVDGVRFQGGGFDPAVDYPANQVAAEWTDPGGSGNYLRLLPTTHPDHPGILRLCWEIKTAATLRLACTHHAGDGHIFGADIIEDIDSAISRFDWQWEATPRPDGQAYTLADYAPGGIAGLPARNMACVTRTFGPAGGTESSTRPVTLTPSEIRVGDEILMRHGNLSSSSQTEGDTITYTHEDALPVGRVVRSYRLRAGELLDVNWSILAGASGFSSECTP